MKKLRREQQMLSNKARFVEEVCEGDLVVSNRKKIDLLQDLHGRDYALFDGKDTTIATSEEETEEVEDEDVSTAQLSKGYEYLLGMKIWSLTFEKAEELRAQLAERTKELEELEKTPPSELWERDLSAIEEALDDRDHEIAMAANEEKEARKKSTKRNAAKAKKGATAKKRQPKNKIHLWDNEDELTSGKGQQIVDNARAAFVSKKAAATKRKPSEKASMKTGTTTKTILQSIPLRSPEKNMESDDDDDMDLENDLMSRLKKQSAQASKKKPVVSKDVYSDHDSNSGSHSAGSKRPSPKSGLDLTSKKPKKMARKTPISKKVEAKKRQEIEEETEDEFDFDGSDTDDSDSPPPPRTAPARSRRGNATTTNYAAMLADSDDSEEEDSDSDF